MLDGDKTQKNFLFKTKFQLYKSLYVSVELLIEWSSSHFFWFTSKCNFIRK